MEKRMENEMETDNYTASSWRELILVGLSMTFRAIAGMARHWWDVV